MPAREQLHHLVDRLTDNETEAVLKLVAAFHLMQDEPALFAALTAPDDDEPYTEEQQRQDAEARAAVARGEYTTLEDLKRELGL